MATLISFILMVGVILLAGVTLASAFGRWFWLFELCTHFRAQYAALLLACAAGLAAAHHTAWAAAAGLLGASNLLTLLPAYGRLVIPGPQPAQKQLRALLINVNFRSKAYARTLAAIKRLNPDFVCAIEVNRAWKERLLTLRGSYPYMQGMAFRNGWGMWFMSRFPIERSQAVWRRDKGIPHIVADLSVSGKRLSVIVTHPYAPVTRRYAALRNEQLAALRHLVGSQKRPLLVLGDFNCTPWSPYFSQLLKMGGLRDSRQGFGLQPAWPVWNAFLRIPIDHCLVSSGIAVSGRQVGPDVGSDHLPIVVDFSIL